MTILNDRNLQDISVAECARDEIQYGALRAARLGLIRPRYEAHSVRATKGRTSWVKKGLWPRSAPF